MNLINKGVVITTPWMNAGYAGLNACCIIAVPWYTVKNVNCKM